MKSLQYLSGPEGALFLPAFVAGAAVALLCGVVSVLVVLRRLSFIGHGVAHAAFGGVGIAALLGLTAAGAANSIGFFLVVGGVCVASAVGIGIAGTHTKIREDALIGVVLVGCMAMGALLLHVHTSRGGSAAGASLESSLFGSIFLVSRTDALASCVIAATVSAVLWLARRSILFWAFDEASAKAFGVETLRARVIFMALLGVTVVAAMKLAGVLLATALLILPGATALRLSDRLSRVVVISALGALVGVMGGLVLSIEVDWPPGPSIVAVLVALALGAWGMTIGKR